MKSVLAITAAAAALLTGSAFAGTIYSNGPYNGTINAWNINTPFEVGDSFAAENGSIVNQITFETWNIGGTTPASVTWGLYSGDPLQGPATLIGTGSAAISFTDNGAAAFGGYELFADSISIPDVVLNQGSNANYWLVLSSGVDNLGEQMYWDQNNGASIAWQVGTGHLPGSEAFSILGTAGTPEPAAWTLLLAGFAGLGAALRSRRRLATA